MRVTFLGLRGFPGVQGGVETHAENLCPLIAEHGCSVEVICRSPYHPKDLADWRSVSFKRIWAPQSKRFEAIVHSLLGVLYAGFVSRPDILHIHAIGPAIVTPLARFLGLRVVVTHHGPDYDRQKWGRFAKLVLRMGERFGMRHSNARIVISRVIEDIVARKHKRESRLIPNGVSLPDLPTSTDALRQFGLEPGKYVLIVSRLVPEKRHLDLIDAFGQAAIPGWKLAIVGGSDHRDAYTREILSKADKLPNVVCTGVQTGLPLKELYGHAGLFVLPSSHEGLPIALLEALSYGVPVVASDIPANLEVGLPKRHYFPLGNIDGLSERIREFSLPARTQEERDAQRVWVSSRFNWQKIAASTVGLYREIVLPGNPVPVTADRLSLAANSKPVTSQRK